MNVLNKLSFVACVLAATTLAAEDKQPNQILMNIQIRCPASAEFQTFKDSIPQSDGGTSNFEEWKESFVYNMKSLIQLVESEKIGNCSWTVDATTTTDENQ